MRGTIPSPEITEGNPNYTTSHSLIKKMADSIDWELRHSLLIYRWKTKVSNYKVPYQFVMINSLSLACIIYSKDVIINHCLMLTFVKKQNYTTRRPSLLKEKNGIQN